MQRAAFSRLVPLILVLLLVQLAVPALTAANHRLSKKAHWQREENPFTLEVGDNVDTDWNQALDRAANEWSRSRVLNLNVVPGGTSPQACRPDSGRVEVCSANYGETGWLGITGFFFRDRHIKAAVVGLNDYYFDTPAFGLDDPKHRLSVTCHELGHSIGLAHRSGNSCMVVKDFPTDPDDHDYRQLEEIYEHEDDRTTIERAVDVPLPDFYFQQRVPTADAPGFRDRPHVVVEDLGNRWKLMWVIDWR